MKQITLKIDDRVFDKLCAQANFAKFIEGCVREPSQNDKVMHAIVEKLKAGKSELELGVKGEPIQ